MEMGCDGVFVNSAIALAQDPILMAKSMKEAVISGRSAYLSGRMAKMYRESKYSSKRFLINYIKRK